jgi:hypothetical protein
VLKVEVRYDEKDATVSYLPGKVTLDQILARYADTPFGVSPSGPVVTIARTTQGTLRGWTARSKPPEEKSGSDGKGDAPNPIQLFLEFTAGKTAEAGSRPRLSFADPPAAGLGLLKTFEEAKVKGNAAAVSARFVAELYETVALAPGEITVPVKFEFNAAGKTEGKKESANHLAVVLRTTKAVATSADPDPSGVFLIGGTLDLRLGHLCDQTGCVHHFHQSLRNIRGLGAVNPRPGLEDPRATVYLRAGQPVDVWGLRKDLREQSIEVAGIVPRDLAGYRLRIELPRWRVDKESSDEVQQCMSCRERVSAVLEELEWATDITVSGGGINFRPKNFDVDLVRLLDAMTDRGAAPSTVWLVPAGVPMPRSAPPLDVNPQADPKTAGSLAHPRIEFDLSHTCEVGSHVASLLHQQKWASETRFEAGDLALAHARRVYSEHGIELSAPISAESVQNKQPLVAHARRVYSEHGIGLSAPISAESVQNKQPLVAQASIADRKYASLTPLLSGLLSAGHAPRSIRLREFGDLRVQLEFAHICGDVVYSKPPKPKKKKKGEEQKDEKPKKPFVPQPVKMADSSNGVKAIKAAIESVAWVKQGLFYEYHTKFEFRGGPRKITFALQASGEDVVRLDELIDALREAGVPPKSVVVSRRFAGIPFAKPLPGDLELTDRDGKKQTLAAFKKPDRPLAVAFVYLKTKSRKYGKYEADPKLFARLGATIDQYKDRVDVVAISSNKDDEFSDVTAFWEKTGLEIPLLHDESGETARAVFNAQITPPPHIFVFDGEGLLRYGGDAHSNWEKPDEKHEDYLAKALDLVIAGKYLDNGAVFYNSRVCNCSHPACKCPKCGCGSTCRCGIKHCGVGF